MLKQPDGLQVQLLTLPREAREWVLDLATENELQRQEIERLRIELSENIEQLGECRKLLLEACEAICSELQPSMGYDRFMIRREWRVEAMQAGGCDA